MTADKMISYAELVKRFDDCCGECGCCIHHLPDHSERNTHCLILNSLKAVDAAPVAHGQWLRENIRPKSYLRVCSVCGKVAYFCGEGCSYKFCPNCGAMMRLKEEDHV